MHTVYGMKTLNIDLDSDTPVYRQIATEIRALIAGGALVPGETLPGVREIAQRLGLNLNTVAKAYRLLAEEGAVEVRPGAAATIAEPAAKSAVSTDSLRALRDVLGRWATSGVSRHTAEEQCQRLLDEFYRSEKP